MKIPFGPVLLSFSPMLMSQERVSTKYWTLFALSELNLILTQIQVIVFMVQMPT